MWEWRHHQNGLQNNQVRPANKVSLSEHVLSVLQNYLLTERLYVFPRSEAISVFRPHTAIEHESVNKEHFWAAGSSLFLSITHSFPQVKLESAYVQANLLATQPDALMLQRSLHKRVVQQLGSRWSVLWICLDTSHYEIPCIF